MFGAAVLRVPFVDALTALCDPELPLTQHEYEEWGDPNDTQDLLKVPLNSVARSVDKQQLL